MPELVKFIQTIAHDKGISQEKLNSNQQKISDLFNQLGFKALDQIKNLLKEMGEEERTGFESTHGKLNGKSLAQAKAELAQAESDLRLKEFIEGSSVDTVNEEGIEESGSSKKQELTPEQEKDKLFELAAKLDIGGGEAVFLHQLEKRVPFASLNEKLDSIRSDEEKKTMLRTFIQIGKELKSKKAEEGGIFAGLKKMIGSQLDQIKYVTKNKNKQGMRISHAFAIDQKHIYIIPKEALSVEGLLKSLLKLLI